MSEGNGRKLSTDPYKGVRDFYPEDQAVQSRIFAVWRRVVERYGYEEYNASILEPAELYRSKTSEEIVNEQTYTFTDRGNREVTLRPEMTPTVARMISGRRRDLSSPVRWYSIPNVFRYERPQRGRLREHWQLNVDVFGVDSIAADIEVISIAYDIMREFGATEEDFQIRVNNRQALQRGLEPLLKDASTLPTAMRLIDRKGKMPPEEFDAEWQKISLKEFVLPAGDELDGLIGQLAHKGMHNVLFDPGLVRGFDYYTGTVFELFDTDPQNNRSLFGGGRYDNLLELFGDEKIPAVGFGMGDVTIRDFLETHGLLSAYRSSTDVYVCTVDPAYAQAAEELAQSLRADGVNVAVNLLDKKLGDQIRTADKKKIPFVVAVGKEEVESGIYTLKDLSSGKETKGPAMALTKAIKGSV
jgi:histidyl-tRNA synthetase